MKKSVREFETLHYGPRKKSAQHSAGASAKAFGKVNWTRCNTCSYEFKKKENGEIDMKDFKEHKSSCSLPSPRKYAHKQ